MKAVLSNLIAFFGSILLRAGSEDEVWSILIVFIFLARADVSSKHAFQMEVLRLLREANLWYTEGLISKEAYCVFVQLQQQCSSLLRLAVPFDNVHVLSALRENT
jgi:hypothetical protein